MGFWNFVGKMVLFNFIWKQLFGSGKASVNGNGGSSVRVRGIVSEPEWDARCAHNEEALDAVDDIEARLDDYEYHHYEDDVNDDYSGTDWHSPLYDDDLDRDDLYAHDHYDFSHDDYDFGHDDYLDDDW